MGQKVYTFCFNFLPRGVHLLPHKFITYHMTFPREAMNRVTAALAKKYRDTDTVTLLLVDEVNPCYGNLQTTPDWRDLKVRENVIWLVGLSPRANFAISTEVLPPENKSVLTRPLVYKHRNCPQIRNL